MNINQKLNSIYEDSGVVIKNKVSGVFFVLLVIMTLVPVVVVQSLMKGEIGQLIVEVAIEASMAVSLVALFKGRYRFASTTHPLSLFR